jgi:hypothetical protein
MLPCEDIPIFLEEFDEHKFLFGVQIIAYVSNLGRLLHRQWDCFAERVLRLDGRLGLGHDRVPRGGGLDQGLLQVLELYGCCESVDRLTTLPVVVIGPIDLFIHCNKDMCESFFSFLKRTYQIQPSC